MRKIHSNVAMAVVTAGLVASLGALAPTVALADDVQPVDAVAVESNEPEPVSVVDSPVVAAAAPAAADAPAAPVDEPVALADDSAEPVAVASSDAGVALSLDADGAKAPAVAATPAATTSEPKTAAQPRRAPAAESVAKIGGATYGSLDDALAAAKDGDTIELLGNASTEKGFGIHGANVTVKGNNHTVTAHDHGIYIAKNGDKSASLTFDNVTLDLAPAFGTPTVAGDGYSWAACVVNYDCALTFNNSKVTFAPAGNVNHGIYYHARSKVNLNGTTMTVSGFGVNGICSDVEPGGTAAYSTELNVLGGSDLSVTGNRAGITAGVQITVDDSKLTNSNNRGNGSNGADYIGRNGATLDVSSNGAHGMSARNISLTGGSKATCNSNGYSGVYFYGNMDIDGTSSMTVNHNASKGGGGLRAMRSGTTAHVASGAVVEICDNGRNGLENYGTFTFDEGAKLTVMRNHETGRGGGIFNGASGKLTLPSDAAIYNNHADKTGDDIFSLGVLILGATGDDWKLDDQLGNCSHPIGAWYDDAADARWAAHGAEKHIVPVDGGKFEGELALKAAHGLVRVDYDYVGDAPEGAILPDPDLDLEPGAAYDAAAQEGVEGWTFDGWYVDEDCTVKWVDGDELPGSMTLFGKWTKDPEPEKPEPTTPDKPAPASPDKPASPVKVAPAATTTATPQTGDATPTTLPLALAGTSLLALGLGALLRRRHN